MIILALGRDASFFKKKASDLYIRSLTLLNSVKDLVIYIQIEILFFCFCVSIEKPFPSGGFSYLFFFFLFSMPIFRYRLSSLMDILNVIKLGLTIPFPYVSGNHIWKRSGRAVYLVPKAREYYNAVAYTVASNSCDVGLSCALKVTMLVYPPDKRKRDLTNLLKVIEDALTKAHVWEDDSLVHHLDVKKMEIDKTCPRIEILIESIDAA